MCVINLNHLQLKIIYPLKGLNFGWIVGFEAGYIQLLKERMKWFKCKLLLTRMYTFSLPSTWAKIVSEVTELKMNNIEWWNSNSMELYEFVEGSELARFGACCQINKVALTLQIFLITIPIQSEKWLFDQWSFSGIKFVL